MSGSILSRLVWKEYRLLRGFWWAMLIAALLGQLYVLWQFSNTPSLAQTIFLIGIALTACYALGCGATAFAGEREMGTYAFQRVLPVTPPEVLLGKMLFAALSTLVLGVLLWFIATLLVYLRWRIGAGSYVGLALLGAFKSIELLVWGVFFSLLLARPLRAIVLAALATVVISYPLSWLLSDIPDHARTIFYFPSFLGDSATLIPRAIIVMLVVGCDIYLVSRWFRESKDDGGDLNAREVSLKTRARWLSARLYGNPQRQRLLWQVLVRSRWMLAVAALTYLVLLLLVISVAVGSSLSRGGQQLMLLGILVPVGGLMGVFVFADDQLRHQFRFFAEHGISPRQVWWSRQLFWMGILLLSLLVVTATEIALNHNSIDHDWYWRALGALCGVTILAYSAGQLCSQWIRSNIVAGPATLALAIVLTAWSLVMFAMWVSPWVAVVPIPFVLLLATWATVDDWIKENTQGRVRIRKALLLAVPTLLILASVVCFRWFQIPAVTPQFKTVSYTDAQLAEWEETGKLYAQLWDRYGKSVPPDEDILNWSVRKHDASAPFALLGVPIRESVSQWLISQQDLVEAIETVARRKRFYWPTNRGPFYSWQIGRLQQIMVLSARQRQKSGQLDEALDQYLAALWMSWQKTDQMSTDRLVTCDRDEKRILRYLCYWASESGQTPDRIRRAVASLQDFWSEPLPYENGIENQYRERMTEFSNFADGKYPKSPRSSSDERFRSFNYWFFHLLPWERARAERLIKADAVYDLEIVATLLKTVDQGVPVDIGSGENEQLMAWYETTLIPGDRYYWIRGSQLPSFVLDETVRRGTLLVLALEGWRLEHGQLPASLEMLVPDWFDALPLDPTTAQPFSYYPRGLETPLEIRNYAGVWSYYGPVSDGRLKLAPRTAYLSAPIPGRNHPELIVVFPIYDRLE